MRMSGFCSQEGAFVLKTLTKAFSQTSSSWSLPTVRQAALMPNRLRLSGPLVPTFSTPNLSQVLLSIPFDVLSDTKCTSFSL
jgi:hypothetical protein